MPSWMKLIVTVRSSMADMVKNFGFHKIYLDQIVMNKAILDDLHEYVDYRITTSSSIAANISSAGGRGGPGTESASNGSPNLSASAAAQQQLSKFQQHLQTLSRGCLLFVKMVLDLIERGHLVLKSSNYKVLEWITIYAPSSRR